MEKQRDILRALVVRYRRATRLGKALILNELVAITGQHRKHLIRRLNGTGFTEGEDSPCPGRRIYDEAVKEALILIWEAADRICGRRLKAILPGFLESMERHGHLAVDPVVRSKLLAASAATLDRLLAPVRQTARGRRRHRRRPNALLKRQVAVRTFADWSEVQLGHCEADFVAHNGGISEGACVHSLVLTDVYSGWTECLALVVRQQDMVVQALDVLRSQMPFALLGLNTDNDGAFMNTTVFEYCRQHGIQLTRSREYHKNDQAWIEQKNGSVVRRLVGYDRFVGIIATQVLCRLYQLSRLYVNFYQPSFKLRSKERVGAKVRKTYFRPATPYERLLDGDRIGDEIKQRLREQQRRLDPVKLLHGIRELQGTLTGLAKPSGFAQGTPPPAMDLKAFLAELPRLWQDGEARPTHRAPVTPRRYWRTRVDPFRGVWPDVLGKLQAEPDVTAKELFHGLQAASPGKFHDGQLRTLQRRVREWRRAMARELLYAGVGAQEPDPEPCCLECQDSGNILR